MSDERYEWHTASEQRGNRSPSHHFHRLHPFPCYIYYFPLLQIHPAWCFWSFFFLSSFFLSMVSANQQRILHCTTYCCYLFPSGDCAFTSFLHFWPAYISGERTGGRAGGVCCYCTPPFLSSHFWFVVLDSVFDLPRGSRPASPLQLVRLCRLACFCSSHYLPDMSCSVDLPRSPMQL
ncbi:uncharacterized protein K441DRAFT_115727 [Cenococcum geophilum 1.58]|uniref:uncharacterized protein n=1 Tax=Cenococcum geophilum 1.58 TaxID=794803 RepID=UPI00358EE68D|nr:hypothetical protein K441DRAFT_115727 [Cenococcum geophilum 1.58]